MNSSRFSKPALKINLKDKKMVDQGIIDLMNDGYQQFRNCSVGDQNNVAAAKNKI